MSTKNMHDSGWLDEQKQFVKRETYNPSSAILDLDCFKLITIVFIPIYNVYM